MFALELRKTPRVVRSRDDELAQCLSLASDLESTEQMASRQCVSEVDTTPLLGVAAVSIFIQKSPVAVFYKA